MTTLDEAKEYFCIDYIIPHKEVYYRTSNELKSRAVNPTPAQKRWTNTENYLELRDAACDESKLPGFEDILVVALVIDTYDYVAKTERFFNKGQEIHPHLRGKKKHDGLTPIPHYRLLIDSPRMLKRIADWETPEVKEEE